LNSTPRSSCSWFPSHSRFCVPAPLALPDYAGIPLDDNPRLGMVPLFRPAQHVSRLTPCTSVKRWGCRSSDLLSAIAAFSVISALMLGAGCDSAPPGESEASECSGLPILAVDQVGSPAGEGAGMPFLVGSEDGVWLSWLQESGNGHHSLLASHLVLESWSAPVEVIRSDNLFVNWADFPIVTPKGDGLWALWLQRGATGGYDYAVEMTGSDDGLDWMAARTLHDDDSPTEHGSLSAISLTGSGNTGFVRLDGRKMVHSDGGWADREMTLRYREVRADGGFGEEVLLDGRTCECCQTDVVQTPDGPAVFYRDRSLEEIRDIYVVRRVEGIWSEPSSVHDDGWEFGGCPVNGPQAAMATETLAVAWFMAAGGLGRVQFAMSEDNGATFGTPLRIDGGDPLGRVELAATGAGDFVVFWLERVGDGDAELRARLVGSSGQIGPHLPLALTSEGRASGFPRAAGDPYGSALVAWTELSGGTPWVRLPSGRADGG